MFVVTTDASSHRLGRYMQRAGSLGALDRAPTALAHKMQVLLAVHLALRQFRPLLLGKHVLVHTDNTEAVSYITDKEVYDHVACHNSPAISSSAVRRGSSQCAPSTFRGAQSCGRCALMTAQHSPENGDSIPRRSGWPGVDLEKPRWTCFASLPACIIPWPRPPRHGHAAHSWPRALRKYAFPRWACSPRHSARSEGRGTGPVVAPPTGPPGPVSGTHAPRGQPLPCKSLWGRTSFSQGLATMWHPLPDLWNLHVWLLDGTRQTWMACHKLWWTPSLRLELPRWGKHMPLKWSLFANWCSSRREDPRRCTIGVMLSFLQERLERRLSPSTLKVYVAAIAAHSRCSGRPVPGKANDLIVRFLRGARGWILLGHPWCPHGISLSSWLDIRGGPFSRWIQSS